MRWTEILNERGYLYHITSPDDAARIIYSNEIKPLTSHHSERLGLVGSKVDAGKGYGAGVSLTRDIGFSKTWLSGNGVILVLDSNLLRRNVRLRASTITRAEPASRQRPPSVAVMAACAPKRRNS